MRWEHKKGTKTLVEMWSSEPQYVIGKFVHYEKSYCLHCFGKENKNPIIGEYKSLKKAKEAAENHKKGGMKDV